MTTNNFYASLPAVIAHRGAKSETPENTLIAFKRAIELGAKWLELDITISADGIAVVHHDAELERCTNGTGLVIQHSLAALKALDCGSWFSPKFKDEPFATLKEVLELANRTHTGLNLEIKPTMGREVETVAAIVKTLAETPPQAPILFSSFNPFALYEAKIQLSEYPRALCTEAIPADWRTRLEFLDAIGLHFQAEFFDAEAIKPLLQAKIGLAVFTVNSPEKAKTLHAAGVQAVFSDIANLLSV